jgi:hypothetical protein
VNRRAIGVAVVVALVAAVGTVMVVRRSDRQSAIQTTIAWARLAPLPTSAHDVSVAASGGAFSRSFDLSFRAPASDIREWLRKSPGVAGAVGEPAPSGALTYRIAPGGGAQVARLAVDYAKERVTVHVEWS